jgi:adenosylmethionine-8-amino-7-oxononanoate aminotransferase
MKRENNSDPIWHPFTQMKTAAAPIHIQRAHECMLFDIDGNSYIDAIASWWVNIHGHGHPAIAAAIAQQASKLEHIIFAGFTHTPAIELANNLLQILPDNFAKVFFSDDGSTSVEVALKMAIQFWYNKGIHHKRKIIAFEKIDKKATEAIGALP